MTAGLTTRNGDPIQVLEGFAGAGGMSEGARMVGLEDGVLGIDINPDACATAKAAGHDRYCGSIRDVDPAQMTGVEAWLSGPPCPTYTLAGKGSGRAESGVVQDAISELAGNAEYPEAWRDITDRVSDPRTALVLETLRFASELPDVHTVVAEQVPPVAALWMDMAAELCALFQYTHVNVITVRADDLGAATRRLRAILIATKGPDFEPDFTGLPVRSWWSAGQCQEPEQRQAIDPIRFPRTTMAQALDWPEGLTINTRGNKDPKSGGNEFSADGPALSMTGNGTRCWYRTDLGSVEGRITASQAGLLQGFPADYPWQGSRSSQFQRIADTVSPLVAAAVIGVATGRPWQDAVHQRISDLYGHGQQALNLAA